MSRTYRKKSDDERSRAWRVIYRRDCCDHYEVPIPGWDTMDRPPLSERTKRRGGIKDRRYKCKCTWCITGGEAWRNRKAEPLDPNIEE